MNLLSFDLEIANSIPEGCDDWKEVRPLGISCAATASLYPSLIKGSVINTNYWFAENSVHKPVSRGMDKTEAQRIAMDLSKSVALGYKIVTWNGLSFDFDVLAEESGLYRVCSELALNHIDLMFIVVTLRGHFLGLDKAAKGHKIPGKLKSVKLNDGTIIKDMAGASAPGMWHRGEFDAVLAYLKDDVRITLELARSIEREKYVKWKSDKGYKQKIKIPKLYTVKECLEIKRKIPHWVIKPVELKSMMSWVK